MRGLEVGLAGTMALRSKASGPVIIENIAVCGQCGLWACEGVQRCACRGRDSDAPDAQSSHRNPRTVPSYGNSVRQVLVQVQVQVQAQGAG